MATGFTLNGLDLRQSGWEIASVAGWDSFPGLRIPNVEYAYRHGSTMGARGFYQPKDIAIQMWVLPLTPAGATVHSDPAQHIQENVDDLLGALHSTSNSLVLSRAMPDGTTRTIDVYPVSASTVEDGRQQWGPHARGFNMLLTAPYPFWESSVLDSEVAQTTTFNVVNDGNAPINNFSIVFNVAGTLTNTTTGEAITVTEAVTVDLAAKTVKSGATHKDDVITVGEAWWMELQPGTNAMSCSGGANVDVSWRDHWF